MDISALKFELSKLFEASLGFDIKNCLVRVNQFLATGFLLLDIFVKKKIEIQNTMPKFKLYPYGDLWFFTVSNFALELKVSQ